MSQFERVCRVSVVGLVALLCAAVAVFPVSAKDPPAGSKAIALPEPLTKESVRELVSRLSDEQVRKLLIDQLDRAAAPAKATTTDVAGVVGMVEQSAEMMSGSAERLLTALVTLPATASQTIAKLSEPEGSAYLLTVAALLAAILAAGWGAEQVYRRVVRNYRTRLEQSVAETFAANAFRIGVLLALDVAAIAVFAAAAVALFFAAWHGHQPRRMLILWTLTAVVIVRITALLARFLLAPATPQARLLPIADEPAHRLSRFAVALATIYGVGSATAHVVFASGASSETIELIRVITAVLVVATTLWAMWSVRAAIGDLIRGPGKHGALIGWLADLWPVMASLYLIVIFVAVVSEILLGVAPPAGAGILSIVLIIALPIVDMALCRALAAAASTPPTGGGLPASGRIEAYAPVLRRVIHIVVVLVGLLWLADMWNVDLFALTEKSLGGKIAGALFDIVIVLLLAYMLWEVAKTAIDRRLRAEGEQRPDDHDLPSSRLVTVLPILRATILVTVAVIATLSTLAALGVNIVPLLAGASVVGVAIGFGSQTLVRDIVSGAFFLMDDAFRLGEYIEVGDAKGTIEKINVRSLFLRHHRGALNILPYGEIKRLRNTSRDWMIVVMEFRLTYDTNMQKVKKIIKQIGAEISADPEFATDLLQPLKLQGVMSTEDSAIVVRAKFMAKPTNAPFMIRRVAYDKIIKAFREAGITFAHRQVTVYVPPSADSEQARNAAAGAAAAAALDAPASKQPGDAAPG